MVPARKAVGFLTPRENRSTEDHNTQITHNSKKKLISNFTHYAQYSFKKYLCCQIRAQQFNLNLKTI